MARVSRLTQLSGLAVICYIFAAAFYLIFLIYSQYQAQDKLRDSARDRNLRENEKKALTISYFISERSHDLNNLAESRSLLLYFENQALGMSREYGLNASISAINDMLLSFRERRTLQGAQLFKRISCVDNSGNILFESSDTVFNGKLKPPLITHQPHDADTETITFGTASGEGYLIISIPIHFKGSHQGTLSGWIPVQLVHRHFVESTDQENAHYNLLLFKDSYISGVAELATVIPTKSLPSPMQIRSNKNIADIETNTIRANTSVQTYLNPIAKTPLALASFYLTDKRQTGPQPVSPYILLGGIGLALLAGGVGFYRANMRSLALEVRLEENLVREKLIEEKNFGLRKLMTALEQSPNSIVITDINGEIEYVNPHFCQVTGYSTEEVLGKNPRVLQSGEESTEKYQHMWLQVLSGSTWTGEFLNRKKNGDQYWEQANIAPVCNEQGVIVNIIAIKEDITERKRAEQEMRAARLAAEAANRAKSEFLANMSHEIRTPMNGIIGMTDLCLQTQLDNQQHSYLSAVRISADNLLIILNDILDFSKIEAGKIDLVQGPFLLRTLVGQALQALATKATERNLELILHPSAEIPDALIGDPGRLKQVLINLVSNAVKFSENGRIIVSVTCKEENESGCLLYFSVADSGIGIASEHLKSIFAPFEQGDVSTTKAYGGTGLGLSISKNLVELMGGEITVESSLGVGSTFTFTARFTVDNAGNRQRDYSNIQGKTALVVDDCAINRIVIADFLKSWGVSTFEAEDAPAALSFLEQTYGKGNPIDFLLTDCNMPHRSGWQLIDDLRHNKNFEGIRTIIMPSAGLAGDAAKCRELGIDGYLPKPIIHGELYELLCAIISPEHSDREHGLPVTSHSLRDERKRLTVLAAEDVLINQEIIRALLNRYGHRVEIVQNGAEAVTQWREHAQDYDLILMDIQMPIMDGLQATRSIRSEEKILGSHIPIIAMTAYAMKEDRERCLSAGMDDYLSKPFKNEELQRVLSLYGTSNQDPVLVIPEPDSPATECQAARAPQANTVFNRQELSQRIGGKDDLIDQLLNMFTALAKRCCTELTDSLEQEDSEAVRRSLHTLTGAAANIGANQMHQRIMHLHAEVKRGNLSVMNDGIIQLERELELFEDCARL